MSEGPAERAPGEPQDLPEEEEELETLFGGSWKQDAGVDEKEAWDEEVNLRESAPDHQASLASHSEHAALVAADKRHGWHPFTPMAEWCADEHDPILLVSGEGALLRDTLGREYIDGNSSIWTNLHGHNHPRLNAALQRQLGKVAHTSFLGFGQPPAAHLARELVELWPPKTLTRVFFSDDGSTAVEVALKIAAQFWQQSGEPRRQKFVAFSGAYHGDTMGASSLGGIGAFHERFAAWQFPVLRAASVNDLEGFESEEIAAVIIEPLIQGANQMRLWPSGMLKGLRQCAMSGACC